MTEPLLTISHASLHYPVKAGLLRRQVGVVKAVDNVSLDLAEGETLGLVGESGCGKTTLGRAVLGLRDLTSGEIRFEGQSVTGRNAEDEKRLRQNMQLVFQDPYAALDPSATIGAQIRAGLDIHQIGSKAERAGRVAEVMRDVGLDPALADRYPHEFSGGMRQRVAMARALILRPKLLVCDEPTSALDVSVQAQILNSCKELQESLGISFLFISHNLSVVQFLAHRVAVMYLGRIVELAPTAELFAAPRHPYTRALLASIAVPDPTHRLPPPSLNDDAPSAENLPTGCRFRSRCPIAIQRCAEDEPMLPTHGRHRAACWLADDVSA